MAAGHAGALVLHVRTPARTRVAAPVDACHTGARGRYRGADEASASGTSPLIPRVETERLLLRLPQLGDVDDAAVFLGDPEVMRYLGGRTGPREDAPAVVRRWLDRWEQSGLGYFVVERRTDGCWLGRVGINVWDAETWTRAAQGEPELSWALARAHWGNGYATEAGRAVRDWARHERGVGRLISLIAPENVRSQGVALRLGAVAAGTVPDLEGSGPHVIWVHPP